MFVKSAQVTDIFISDNAGQDGELAESSSKPTTELQKGDNTQPLKSKHTLLKLWTPVDVTLHFLNSFFLSFFIVVVQLQLSAFSPHPSTCLLYTSDAADDANVV